MMTDAQHRRRKAQQLASQKAQRKAVKAETTKDMDIIGEVLPSDDFKPEGVHRRVRIAGGRGVCWPKGLIKRVYLFGIPHERRGDLLPGTLVCLEHLRELKKGKHRCLSATNKTIITILPTAGE
ncbi:TPA: hypothetical protein JDC63_000859 [Salmonella enterica subsp. arizonae]|nr:hypothetical protein [Salmonella enterica subsp. arizonae]